VRLPSFTAQFKRDVKRVKKRRKNTASLQAVLELLIDGEPLPPRYKDHTLGGNWVSHRECSSSPTGCSSTGWWTRAGGSALSAPAPILICSGDRGVCGSVRGAFGGSCCSGSGRPGLNRGACRLALVHHPQDRPTGPLQPPARFRRQVPVLRGSCVGIHNVEHGLALLLRPRPVHGFALRLAEVELAVEGHQGAPRGSATGLSRLRRNWFRMRSIPRDEPGGESLFPTSCNLCRFHFLPVTRERSRQSGRPAGVSIDWYQ